MHRNEAEVLLTLFEHGYLVIVNDHAYVDSAVYDMFEEGGEIVYSSETFDERPLKDVDEYQVSVYKPALDEWEFNTDAIDEGRLDAFEDMS